jgi:hypothetical protein
MNRDTLLASVCWLLQHFNRRKLSTLAFLRESGYSEQAAAFENKHRSASAPRLPNAGRFISIHRLIRTHLRGEPMREPYEPSERDDSLQ